MSTLPAAELTALASLSGYDQMLQIDQIARQYSIDESEVKGNLQRYLIKVITHNQTLLMLQPNTTPRVEEVTFHRTIKKTLLRQ